MKKITIAVDGTAGSGKTTIMSVVAKKLNFNFIDTGLLYRAFTKFCLIKNYKFNDVDFDRALKEFNVIYKDNQIYINGENYTNFLFDKSVLNNIGFVTVNKNVRDQLTKIMQNLANERVIMIGRDIGTIVLPNAKLKFYFDTDYKIRAQRRFEQNKKNNINPNNLKQIEELIIKRDELDKNREFGPLKKTDDAIYIDTGKYDKNECIEFVCKLIKENEA